MSDDIDKKIEEIEIRLFYIDSPEALTDQVYDQYMKDARWLIDQLKACREENERYRNWVNDLQTGMYINCVYCGHRYGPDDEVPASMADVLKEHIEKCPKHPLSKIKAELETCKAEYNDFITNSMSELGKIDREKAGIEQRTKEACIEAGWNYIRDCGYSDFTRNGFEQAIESVEIT